MKHVIDPTFAGLVLSDAGEFLAHQIFAPRTIGGTLVNQPVTVVDDANALVAEQVYHSKALLVPTVRAGDGSVVVTQDALGYVLTAPGGGVVPDDAGLQVASQVYQPHPRAIPTIRASDASIIVTQDALGYSLSAPVDNVDEVISAQVFGMHGTALSVVPSLQLKFPDDQNYQISQAVYQPHRSAIPTVRASDASLIVTQDALGYVLNVPFDTTSDVLANQVYGSHGLALQLTAASAPVVDEANRVLGNRVYGVQPPLTRYVPYQGAIDNVQLGLHNLALTGYIDVGAIAQPVAPAAGIVRLHAFTNNGFTRIEQDNEAPTNVTLGRDNVFLGRNTTVSTIVHGSPVYVTGSTGNVPNIGLAKADSLSTLPAIGIALDNIAPNAFGQILVLGGHFNHDTSMWGTGDRLFVSATTAGALTNVLPLYPNFVQRMGSVLVSGVGNGSMMIETAPYIGDTATGTNSSSYGIGPSTGAGAVIITFNNGSTGTLTWTPTGARTITLPDLTGTVALGAGSSTATSTNDVTVASHTHAIDSTIARSAITVIGTGALGGGGDLTANRTITMNTPGTLTVSSVNSSAVANHTHAVTSSSAPGAAASLLATSSTGSITFGSSASQGFTIQPVTANAGSAAYALAITPYVNNATSSFYGAYISINTTGAGFTTGNAINLGITDPVKNGADVITTAYGIYIANITAGATNYAIYSAGGYIYFGGAVFLGSTLYSQAASNQIVLNSSGVTGTLTWTPTSTNKVITLPDWTGTVALGADTLTVSTTNTVATSNHTHAITSSSNPQASAKILATASDGSINFASVTAQGFNVQPLASAAGANVYGITTTPYANNTTGQVDALYARANTFAAGFTLTYAIGVHIANPVKGATSTITEARGLWIENITSGNTNYSIYTSGGALRFDSVAVANGSVATTMTSLGPAGSHTTIQKWLAVNLDGTVGYIPVY